MADQSANMTDNVQSAPSPLAEASINSLDHFFNLDPMGMTRQSRDAIVAELRRMRVKWEESEALGKKTKPTKAVDATAVAQDLKDLGLD